MSRDWITRAKRQEQQRGGRPGRSAMQSVWRQCSLRRTIPAVGVAAFCIAWSMSSSKK